MAVPPPGCRSFHAGLHTEGMHPGTGTQRVGLKASKGVVHPSPWRTGPQGAVQARSVAPKGWCIQACRELALKGWRKQGGLYPKGGAHKFVEDRHPGAKVGCIQRVVHPSL